MCSSILRSFGRFCLLPFLNCRFARNESLPAIIVFSEITKSCCWASGSAYVLD